MGDIIKLKKTHKQMLVLLAGTFLFCLGLNLFVTPMGLYTGGIMGMSQILRTLLAQNGIHFDFEISGYINMLFNIPLMYIAYRSISKKFFTLTLISVIAQMLFSSMIPLPVNLILPDMLTSVIVGGIISGFGVGLILRSSGSAGGIDILGVYFTKKLSNFSVGKISIIINAILFTVCMILFNVETAIYSILNTVVFSFVVDKIHYQNISMTAMIFSRNQEISNYIIKDLHRGVTMWRGYGAYTQSDTFIFVTAVSKYEVNALKSHIKKIDPQAFIIFSEGLSVSGNFEKHL